MWIFKIHFLAFWALLCKDYSTLALQDVTAELFGKENHGTMAAFGDFNSDKQTDIFVITEGLWIYTFFTALLVYFMALKMCFHYVLV